MYNEGVNRHIENNKPKSQNFSAEVLIQYIFLYLLMYVDQILVTLITRNFVRKLIN